jgi:hypothetical protein
VSRQHAVTIDWAPLEAENQILSSGL